MDTDSDNDDFFNTIPKHLSGKKGVFSCSQSGNTPKGCKLNSDLQSKPLVKRVFCHFLEDRHSKQISTIDKGKTHEKPTLEKDRLVAISQPHSNSHVELQMDIDSGKKFRKLENQNPHSGKIGDNFLIAGTSSDSDPSFPDSARPYFDSDSDIPMLSLVGSHGKKKKVLKNLDRVKIAEKLHKDDHTVYSGQVNREAKQDSVIGVSKIVSGSDIKDPQKATGDSTDEEDIELPILIPPSRRRLDLTKGCQYSQTKAPSIKTSVLSNVRVDDTELSQQGTEVCHDGLLKAPRIPHQMDRLHCFESNISDTDIENVSDADSDSLFSPSQDLFSMKDIPELHLKQFCGSSKSTQNRSRIGENNSHNLLNFHKERANEQISTNIPTVNMSEMETHLHSDQAQDTTNKHLSPPQKCSNSSSSVHMHMHAIQKSKVELLGVNTTENYITTPIKTELVKHRLTESQLRRALMSSSSEGSDNCTEYSQVPEACSSTSMQRSDCEAMDNISILPSFSSQLANNHNNRRLGVHTAGVFENSHIQFLCIPLGQKIEDRFVPVPSRVPESKSDSLQGLNYHSSKDFKFGKPSEPLLRVSLLDPAGYEASKADPLDSLTNNVDVKTKPLDFVSRSSSLDSDITQPFEGSDENTQSPPPLQDIPSISSVILKQLSGQSLPPPSLTQILPDTNAEIWNMQSPETNGTADGETVLQTNQLKVNTEAVQWSMIETKVSPSKLQDEDSNSQHSVLLLDTSPELFVETKTQREISQESDVKSDVSKGSLGLFDVPNFLSVFKTSPDGCLEPKVSGNFFPIPKCSGSNFHSKPETPKQEAWIESGLGMVVKSGNLELEMVHQAAKSDQESPTLVYTVDDDMVSTFDSDEEELFSNLTQVQVKKEKLSEDDAILWLDDVSTGASADGIKDQSIVVEGKSNLDELEEDLLKIDAEITDAESNANDVISTDEDLLKMDSDDDVEDAVLCKNSSLSSTKQRIDSDCESDNELYFAATQVDSDTVVLENNKFTKSLPVTIEVNQKGAHAKTNQDNSGTNVSDDVSDSIYNTPTQKNVGNFDVPESSVRLSIISNAEVQRALRKKTEGVQTKGNSCCHSSNPSHKDLNNKHGVVECKSHHKLLDNQFEFSSDSNDDVLYMTVTQVDVETQQEFQEKSANSYAFDLDHTDSCLAPTLADKCKSQRNCSDENIEFTDDGNDDVLYLAATQVDMESESGFQTNAPYTSHASDLDHKDPYIESTLVDNHCSLRDSSDEGVEFSNNVNDVLYFAATQIDVDHLSVEKIEDKNAINSTTDGIRKNVHLSRTSSGTFSSVRNNALLFNSEKVQVHPKSFERARKKFFEIKQKTYIPRTRQTSPLPESRRRGKCRGLKQKLSNEDSQMRHSSAQIAGSSDLTLVHRQRLHPVPSKSVDHLTDNDWLSKVPNWKRTKRKFVSGSEEKRFPKKRQKQSSNLDESLSIAEAKRKLQERNLKAIKDPTLTADDWRKKSSHVDVMDMNMDVELPNTQEVMTKGLPLLTATLPVCKKRLQKWSNSPAGQHCMTNKRKGCLEEQSEVSGVQEEKDSYAESNMKHSWPSSVGTEKQKSVASTICHLNVEKPTTFSDKAPRGISSKSQILENKMAKDKIPTAVPKVKTPSNNTVKVKTPNVSTLTDNTLKDKMAVVKTAEDGTLRDEQLHEKECYILKNLNSSTQDPPRSSHILSRNVSATRSNSMLDRKKETIESVKPNTTPDLNLPNTSIVQWTVSDVQSDTGQHKSRNSIAAAPTPAPLRSSVNDVDFDSYRISGFSPQKNSSNDSSCFGKGTSQTLHMQDAHRPAVKTVRFSVEDTHLSPSSSTPRLNLLQKCPTALQVPRSRPVLGTGAMNKSVTGPSENLLRMDELISRLLFWSPRWLQEYDRADSGGLDSLPPIVDKSQLFPLVTTYEDISEYQQISFKLLMLEIWEEIFRTWKERKDHPQICYVHLNSLISKKGGENYSQSTVGFCCQGILSKERAQGHMHLLESDVVILEMFGQPLSGPSVLGSDTASRDSKWTMQLAYVEKVFIQRCQNIQELLKTNPVLSSDPVSKNSEVYVMDLNLLIRYRKFAPNPNTLMKLYSLGSIAKSLRQFNALTLLYRSRLVRDILRPTRTAFYDRSRPTNQPVFQDEKITFNKYQSQVIRNVVSAVRQPWTVPRICMLHGPPGTGKSHVIIGIILKILQETQNKAKICLAAPSNAAADELLRRLVSRKVEHGLKFSVLRIGKAESTHPDVKSYLWDQRIEKAKQEEIHKKKLQTVPRSIQQEFRNLQTKIEETKRKIIEFNSCRNKLEADNWSKKLQQMKKRWDMIQRSIPNSQQNIKLTPAEIAKISEQELCRANIVCGTLSSFGSGRVFSTLRQDQQHFTCAIIDEATQATELDCLIPLQYGLSKLVLVGDPNQLPPTVLSMKAQSLNYGLSLFERLYNHFQDNLEDEESNPVMMLRIQYRMDPSICSFPSAHMYGGILETDSKIVENCERYPLQPYCVFNVEEGQEKLSQSGSVSNELEAECTAVLCHQLLNLGFNIKPKLIGIICPYNSQKRLLLRKLHEKVVRDIEVNTVDGFQGREKHIIILSCVRARSSTGSIGFLADRRRMNVALTRAKYALFIIGHLQSLKTDADWESLIHDAEKRGVLIQVPSIEKFSAIIKQKCVKPAFIHKIRDKTSRNLQTQVSVSSSGS